MKRRVLCMWFPHLAAERALRAQGIASWAAEPPFAVAGMRRGAWRLCSVNAAAARLGLENGAALADARAIFPALRTAPEQPERDAAFLRALRRWSERYGPWAALDGAEGLALDVTGCGHLFGGEAGLLADAAARCARLGLTLRAGLAETKGAAWALARFAEDDPIAPTGRLETMLSALPVAALRLEPETADGLARLGMRRIADVAAAPRGTLNRRFGPSLLRRLDQMFGRAPEPVSPSLDPKPYAVRLSFPEPIGRLEDLSAALERLLARLCARLQGERRGALALRLWIRRSDGGGDSAEIGLARPSHDPALMARLFASRLEALRAEFGLDAMRLEARSVAPLPLRQEDALQNRATPAAAWEETLSRLGDRVGFDRVTRLAPAQSHLPERAFRRLPAGAVASEPFPAPEAARPILLFPPEPIAPADAATPPQAFRWRGARFEALGAAGPERIAPEWWRADPEWEAGPRDYWRVQTRQGRRLWLFQTHDAQTGGWFAQGEFA